MPDCGLRLLHERPRPQGFCAPRAESLFACQRAPAKTPGAEPGCYAPAATGTHPSACVHPTPPAMLSCRFCGSELDRDAFAFVTVELSRDAPAPFAAIELTRGLPLLIVRKRTPTRAICPARLGSTRLGRCFHPGFVGASLLAMLLLLWDSVRDEWANQNHTASHQGYRPHRLTNPARTGLPTI